MKRLSLSVLALLFALAMTPSSQADDQSSGCGAGWMVTKRNSLVSSIIRNTTNSILSNSIAMTSGTSGCSKHDIVLNEKRAVHFAEANFQHLQVEMAQGSGEFLSAYAETLGCDAQGAAWFGAQTKLQYSSLVSTAQTPAELIASSQQMIAGDAVLSMHCLSAQIVAQL